jgi:hypothetical protein
MGEGNSVVIVIPARLPRAETYTVAVSRDQISFKAGYDEIAAMQYPGGEIFRRLVNYTEVGLVEFPPEADKFPQNITNRAYIEVRRALA